ncbi:MAG: DUF7839 domain-containing protein [Candidatus Syntropharchaeia archaeon]
MVKVLQSKKVSSKLQILVEIAANQPVIRQRDIASKMKITPQAVSEYIKELVDEGMVYTDGRKRYEITKEGVNWVLMMAGELRDYIRYINDVVTNISVWTAIAGDDLKKDQKVFLRMKDGMLYAHNSGPGATAICVSDAKKGEDVGISSIEGLIEMEIGKITICKVPKVEQGGSKNVDLDRLREEVDKKDMVGVMGIEALIALSRIDVVPDSIYGTKEAVVEAVGHGLSFLVVCVEDEIPSLISYLQKENLEYELLDLRKFYI